MARNCVIILIRHAEKPESGPGLSAEGVKHANAYAGFFSHYHLGPQPLKIDALFAAADTKASSRPRLTLVPLSESLLLPIRTEFSDRETAELAALVHSAAFDGKNAIVCWKHGQIMDLANRIIETPEVLPKHAHWPKEWPDSEFHWLLQIVFDSSGALDARNTYCVPNPSVV